MAAFCQVFGFEVDRAHYPEATGDSWMVRVGHSVMCSQYSAIIKLPAINTSQLLTRPGYLEVTPEKRRGKISMNFGCRKNKFALIILCIHSPCYRLQPFLVNEALIIHRERGPKKPIKYK